MRRIFSIPYSIRATVTRYLLGTITSVETKDMVAALTFDDGPHPDSTPHLLEVLARHRVHATFFMLGKAAQRYPEIVRHVAEEGHVIGNHSWDHSSFPSISSSERRRQIRACAKAVAPYGQRLFRPPWGRQTRSSRLDALCLRHTVITWSVDAEDWVEHTSEWILKRLIDKIQPGSVILLHDALWTQRAQPTANRKSVIEAVDMLLEHLGDQFQFVTIPELLRHGHPVLRLKWYNPG